jgi:two-component system sensor histidine kinase YesM
MARWNFLQFLFSKIKVQKQLFLIFFISILIPTFVIGTILLFNNRNLLLNHYQNQAKSDNLRTKSVMFDITTNLYNTSENIMSDDSFKKFLISIYKTDIEYDTYIEGYNRIKTICKNDTSISSLRIYTLKKISGSYEYVKYADDEIKNTDWFINASAKTNAFWESRLIKDVMDNEGYQLILYRKIPIPEIKSYAVLEITVSNNYIKNRISNSELFSIIAVNQDPVFFSNQKKQEDFNLTDYVDYSKKYYKYTGSLDYGDNNYLGEISTFKPYRTDDKIYIITMDTNAYNYVYKITLNYFIIVLIIIVIPSAFVNIFIKYFSKRIIVLREAMYKVSLGHYDIINSFKGDDELSDAFKDLEMMIKKIKEKEANIYKAQIKEQELVNRQQQMEFKMLASQINPHFLYNTLEMIRMKALLVNNKEVSTAIKLLGKSMHYVLNNVGTSSTTLNNELLHIETYLAIQKLRFTDRINSNIEIHDEIDTEKYYILPLLLQPIVENAIIHGLESVERTGRIFIKIYIKENEFLNIRISDNGVGIKKAELDKIVHDTNYHDKGNSDSIGLYNINQRIKLFYGNNYGLLLKSTKNVGTTVDVILPLNSKKEWFI